MVLLLYVLWSRMVAASSGTVLVLWEPLQPIGQKDIRIISSSLVSTEIIVGGRVRVRESNTGGRFQEYHISLYSFTSKLEFHTIINDLLNLRHPYQAGLKEREILYNPTSF